MQIQIGESFTWHDLLHVYAYVYLYFTFFGFIGEFVPRHVYGY